MKHKEITINDGHYFEVMDRAYTICEMMDSLIGNHPLLEVEGELRDKYDIMMKHASEFYQLAGSLEYIRTSDNKNIKNDNEGYLRPIQKDYPDDYQLDN